ncbi:MAG: hypothetical protein HY315_08880 [Acidobacteria bacterium]|nr:hypothetical protein [Acidobacteriota bacterium]
MSKVARRMSNLPRLALVCLFALAPVSGQVGKQPEKARKPVAEVKPVPPPKTKTPAEKVAGVLQEFIVQADLRQQGKNPAEKEVRLSEADLNAYMQEAVKTKARYGLTSIYIKLIGPNYIGATTTIDFGKVEVDDQSLAVRMIRSMLSGEKMIYVEGSVTSGEGKGQFKLEKAYLGSVWLPVYFIEKVINYLGQRQNPPIDTSEPVPLPYGLKKVEVAPGSILLRG